MGEEPESDEAMKDAMMRTMFQERPRMATGAFKNLEYELLLTAEQENTSLRSQNGVLSS